MIGVVAKLFVQEDKCEAFETAMRTMQDQVSEQEPDNHLYLCHRTDKAGTYIILESYASRDALDAHGKSDHYKAFGRAIGSMLAGAPEVEIYEAI